MIKTAFISPIPIYINDTSRFLTDKEQEELLSLDNQCFLQKEGNYVSKNRKILELPNFTNLKSFLLLELQCYVENIIGISNKFVITDSWATRNPKGSSHHMHAHSNSIFSGVYYAACESASLIFIIEPQYSKDFNFKYNTTHSNVVNSQTWKIPVQTGDVVIFPSWVKHAVEVNDKDSDRRIIGFNSFVTGEFGDELNINRLSIESK